MGFGGEMRRQWNASVVKEQVPGDVVNSHVRRNGEAFGVLLLKLQ